MINIAKITIKNYRGLKDLELDLLSNSNGLEKDINLGTFKATEDGKFGIPSFISIFGRNSIGKTTILRAIALIADLNNGVITDILVNKVINKELAKKTIASGINFNSMFSQEQAEVSQRVAKEMRDVTSPSFAKYKNESKLFLKDQFKASASDGSKKIEINIVFQIDGRYVEFKSSIDSEGDLTNKFIGLERNNFSSMIAYFKQIAISSSSYIVDKELSIDANNRGNVDNVVWINMIIINLVDALGEDKAISLIQLADPAIKGINITGRGPARSISTLELEDSKINLMDLSSGTRHFLSMAHQILTPLLRGKHDVLILLDEIELGMHLELTDALKMMMISMFEKYNAQYIFTTHSPMAVKNFTSMKQIFSLDTVDGVTKALKLSSVYKNHQSVTTAYVKGVIAPYPDSEKMRNTIGDIFG